MDQEIQRVGFEIRKLDHALKRTVEARVKEEGIDKVTLMHGWIMRYLYKNRDQEIYQKDIEKQFSIGRSTVTNIIQLMEKKGYVCRESISSDARLKKVVLTQKGIESHEAIESIVSMVDLGMLEGVDENDYAVFLKVIRKIRENLEQQKPSGRKGRADDQDITKRSERI